VLQVAEVCGLEGEVVTMNDIFAFEYQGEDRNGRIQGRWATPALRPGFYDRLDYFGLGEAWMTALREA
jgi:pilus assembly protein CpaF